MVSVGGAVRAVVSGGTFSGGTAAVNRIVADLVVCEGAVVNCAVACLYNYRIDGRFLRHDNVIPDTVDATDDWRLCKIEYAGGVSNCEEDIFENIRELVCF